MDVEALAGNPDAQTQFDKFGELILFQYQARRWLGANTDGPSLQELRDVVMFVAKDSRVYRWENSEEDGPKLTKTSVPLGILASDHSGFVSSDLERSPIDDFVDSEGLPDEHFHVSIFVYYGMLRENRINVIPMGQIGKESIVLFLELPEKFKGKQNALSLPSLQNPILSIGGSRQACLRWCLRP